MKRTAILALFAALGLAAALGYTAKSALAWDIGSLPAPYTVSGFYNVAAQTGECQTFYVITWYDRSITLGYGPPVNQPNFSDCNPQFQYRLDEFVDSTINLTPPVTTTTPPVTTDTTATTTAAVTTTALPTTTDTTPAVVTTAPTQTVTVTTTITDPTINDRLTQLEADYAKLAARVDAIASANTASWTAFSDALTSGASVPDAALAARSAGLNAIYQLG